MGSPVRIAIVPLATALACFSEPANTSSTPDTLDASSSNGASTAGDTTTGRPATDSDGVHSGGSSATEPATTGPATTGPATTDPSTTDSAVCGDGLVDDGEMCDGGLGCTADCTFTNYACNPLNNAGCVADMRCGLTDFATEAFACMMPGQGTLGESCEGAPVNDLQCGDGLTCLFNYNTPLCNVGNCCVEFCNLLTGEPTCSGQTTCLPFFPTPAYDGLEHLGYCGD